MYRSGRHFLQIPGPTNVPDRVLRAIDAPTIDHRGPDFASSGSRSSGHAGGVRIRPVVIYPASGTGAWEAALVNTLSPGDKVIASETGHFATLWREMAGRLGLDVVWLEGDWRHGADPERIADALDDDVRAVWSSTTRPRPASRAAWPTCARLWATTKRCCSWTRSRRWRRSTTATTSGASTSRSAARRRA